MRSDLIEMKGKYGRWTVIEYSHKTKNRMSYWKCKCDCGTIKNVRSANLRNGDSKSCGCLERELTSKRMKNRTGKSNPMYGKVGKEHVNWNPNKTDEERINGRRILGYNKWTQEIYKLDNYICQKCGHRSSNLNAHHIESYNSNPELRTEISNGITFCETCHKDFHHRYGYGNNNRAQLIEFLKQGEYNGKRMDYNIL